MTDWDRLKALLDEFGIEYEIEPSEGNCWKVVVMGVSDKYLGMGVSEKVVSTLNLYFHQGGRYERK